MKRENMKEEEKKRQQQEKQDMPEKLRTVVVIKS